MTPPPTSTGGTGSQNNQRRSTDERTIGNGIIVAYTAFAAAVTAFVLLEHLAAWNGIVVLGLAFLVLFLGDVAIQRADMNGGEFGFRSQKRREGDRDSANHPPEASDRTPD